MEHSGTTRNEVLMHATTWMNLENMCYVEEARHKRTLTVRVHVHETSRTGKFRETRSRLVMPRGGGGGERKMGVAPNVYNV